MRIVLVVLLIVLAMLMGGIYGALYDQLTYTISNEFFTKMRFVQEGIQGDVNVRWEVAKIGFYNTWSVGFGIGLFLSLAGLLHSDNKQMFYTTLQSFLIPLLMAFVFAMIAFFFSTPTEVLEVEVIDQETLNKEKVLSMNNYSYVGGVIGMFVGLGWHVLKTRRYKKK